MRIQEVWVVRYTCTPKCQPTAGSDEGRANTLIKSVYSF